MTQAKRPDWPTTKYDVMLRKKDMEAQFPGSRIVLILESETEKIQSRIREEVSEKTVIEGVFVESDGESAYWKDGKRIWCPKSEQERIDRAAVSIGNPDGGFAMYLTSESDVDPLFGPALNHLAPDVKFIFSGCETLCLGKTVHEKIAIAEKVSKNLKLRSGSVYFNEQSMYEGLRRAFEEPAYQVDSPEDENSLRKLYQDHDRLFKPVFIWMQNRSNRGFLLKVEDHGTNTLYQLYRDNFINARSHRDPTGPLLIEETLSRGLNPKTKP